MASPYGLVRGALSRALIVESKAPVTDGGVAPYRRGIPVLSTIILEF